APDRCGTPVPPAGSRRRGDARATAAGGKVERRPGTAALTAAISRRALRPAVLNEQAAHAGSRPRGAAPRMWPGLPLLDCPGGSSSGHRLTARPAAPPPARRQFERVAVGVADPRNIIDRFAEIGRGTGRPALAAGLPTQPVDP